MPYKKCMLCGKEFYTDGNGRYCEGPHYMKCEVCGKEFLIKDIYQMRRTCSAECRDTLRKSSVLSIKRICKSCGSEFYSDGTRACHCQKCRDHLSSQRIKRIDYKEHKSKEPKKFVYMTCPVCGKRFKTTEFGNIGMTCSEICDMIIGT